jgi:outer membrane protein
MLIKRLLVSISILMAANTAFAIQGIQALEDRLLNNHLDILALDNEVRAQESLIRASRSGYYPTLNLVGGLAQDKELSVGNYQGLVGFVDGRWNLFRGFRDRAFVGQATANYELKKLEFDVKKRTLQIQLTQFLGDLIYVHQLMRILDDESKITQTQRQMASKKVSAGLTGSVDNVEFDLRDSEIEIQRRQLLQQHLEDHQKLASLFGSDISDTELEGLAFENLSGKSVQLPVWEKDKTLAYQEVQLGLKRAQAERVLSRGDFLPSLDLDYRFGHLTPGEFGTVGFNESRFGLLLTIPLFSGFDTASRTRAQTLNISAREKTLEQTARNVEAQLKTLSTKWSELVDLSVINEKRLMSAQKYYELTLSEYKRGVKNSPDVVSATDRWFASQKRKFELMRDLEDLRVQVQAVY